MLLPVLLLLEQAAAWGGDGHRVVAKIASQFLRQSTKWYLWSHLGGTRFDKLDRTLIEDSIWADTVDVEYPWSQELHFSHTEKDEKEDSCLPFDFNRDCGFDQSGRCVVSAIGNYTMRASDPLIAEPERVEALKFLIHFMADIHSPVHVGFASDFGATALSVRYDEKKDDVEIQTSLHEVWDSVVIQRKEATLGDQIDPWTLSMHLLESLLSKDSTDPYLLGIGSGDICSLESATAMAARIASEISTQYTCEWAYKDENNRFIQPYDKLSNKYLSTRAELTGELLKKAGVRLAELLNVIASSFNRREREIQPVAAPSSENREGSLESNPFFLLSSDFDPEALLFTCSNRASAPEEELKLPLPSAKKSARKPKPSAEDDWESFERMIEEKKESDRFVDGVDLDQVVLIKREGAYVVTGSQLVTPRYKPGTFDIFRVSFSENPVASSSIDFVFDAAFFGLQQYSPQLIAAALMRIRKLPYTDSVIRKFVPKDSERADSPLCFHKVDAIDNPHNDVVKVGKDLHIVQTGGDEASVLEIAQKLFGYNQAGATPDPEEVDPEEKQKQKRRDKKKRHKENAKLRQQFNGHLPSQEEIWEAQVRDSLPNICMYRTGTAFFFAHKSTMQSTGSPPIMASMFKMKGSLSSDKVFWYLVDHQIYSGSITPKIADLLGELIGKTSTLECLIYMRDNRPTLLMELGDLQFYHLSDDPDRAHKLRAIRVHHAKPADADKSYYKFYWSIDSNERRDRPLEFGF
jgi:hypothetical protein